LSQQLVVRYQKLLGAMAKQFSHVRQQTPKLSRLPFDAVLMIHNCEKRLVLLVVNALPSDGVGVIARN
jgi:hypothetical protein